MVTTIMKITLVTITKLTTKKVVTIPTLIALVMNTSLTNMMMVHGLPQIILVTSTRMMDKETTSTSTLMVAHTITKLMETMVTKVVMEVTTMMLITIQQTVPTLTLIPTLLRLHEEHELIIFSKNKAEDLPRYGYGLFMLICNIHYIQSILYISIPIKIYVFANIPLSF